MSVVCCSPSPALGSAPYVVTIRTCGAQPIAVVLSTAFCECIKTGETTAVGTTGAIPEGEKPIAGLFLLTGASDTATAVPPVAQRLCMRARSVSTATSAAGGQVQQAAGLHPNECEHTAMSTFHAVRANAAAHLVSVIE